VVDSYETDMRAVSWLLRTNGYDVIHACSCAMARSLPIRFDVTILEVELEDGCGSEFAGELLAAGKARRIVFYTESSSQALLHDARRVAPVVTKEDGPTVLLEVLRSSVMPMSHFPGAIDDAGAAESLPTPSRGRR
jgi:DNA-binding NarL/FixJ family response regulator